MPILDWINGEYIPHLLDGFLNPQKRVSFLYLSIAAALALVWSVYVSRGSLRKGFFNARDKLFSQRVWFSRSARGDYKLLLANHALLLLIAPLLLSKLTATTALFFFFVDLFPSGAAVLSSTSPLLVAITYTIFLFLLDDFSRFATHFALHRVPALWAFHKIHHSAETLSPLTVYRTHPVEAVIFSFRAIVVQSSSISIFVFLFGSSVDLISIYGVNAILFLFNVTGSNLRHSHIPIGYGRLAEHFLISPAQHQIHHSLDPSHYDRNFGAALAIWDWLAGSLCKSRKDMALKFGLTDRENLQSQKLLHFYFSPFRELFDKGGDEPSYRNRNNRNFTKNAV